jgi:hypothetical protein
VKRLMLALLLISSVRAMANSECAGRAADGTFVEVEVATVNVMGSAGQTAVNFEANGNKFGYRVQANETAQYFEYDDTANKSAMVGFSAYVSKNNPVFMKYDGPNFVDMDLKTVIDSGKAPATSAGVMRVWKGPGHAATDQYQITKPVCSVWLNL